GIGRLIWGRVTTNGGVSRVYADLYDVAGKRSLGERTITADSARFTERELRALANSLLAYGPMPAGVDDGQSGTRSFPAWQAYMRAVAALSRWQLDSAERELIFATEADPDFAVAQLRRAQVANWVHSSDDRSWTANARRAAALRAELKERDALLADALLAFGNREYDVACPRYRELVRRDTMAAVAWFSLGACLRADNVVVGDRRSPSGWSFRSSYHSAGKAFLRAFELEPRLYAIPRFDWVRPVFATGRNQYRRGSRQSGGPAGFGSLPLLVADTIAYTPYPMPDWDRESDPLSQSRRSAALSRNADVLLGITTSWTRNFPHSSEAFRELAAVRESRGERTGPTAEAGALQALIRAKELAATKAESLAIGESQVRVLLKLERFPAARTLGDSIFAALGVPSDSNWRSVAKLAGITGRATAFESALQHFWTDFAGVDGLDQTVARAGAELLGRSILGICGPPVNSAEARMRRLMESSVQPDRRAEVHKRVLSHGLSYLTVCTNGQSMATATRDESLIARAQIAFALGNLPRARVMLDTLAKNRAAIRAGEMSINLSAREAALRLHLGDTATAVRILDMTLDAIPTISPSSFDHPLEWAMLVRAMVMRADLAASSGDANTAAKWARAVVELWRNADAPLKPTLARMERLSQMRQANSR
ncbi:MAG: hypothetical protein NUW01_19495, partial [Gemmatimonadaceae bacterium]|nr:hypothetical protein [Gemmatimonadaceae bacterium]